MQILRASISRAKARDSCSRSTYAPASDAEDRAEIFERWLPITQAIHTEANVVLGFRRSRVLELPDAWEGPCGDLNYEAQLRGAFARRAYGEISYQQ
jgi:hypothetical protein